MRPLLVVSVLLLAGCTDEAVNPQDVVDGSLTHAPKQKETRPMFTSCVHASLAGAPLPITVGDPGFNPRLDHDSNGVIC